MKEKYLPEIVAGRRGCNIALTEPDAGSALTHLETTAMLDGDHFILNGTKNFVTGANVNDLNATFVRFDDIPGAKGIGAVVVDTAMDGVTVQRGPTFIGDRGIAHGNLILEDVRVPAENLIVGPGQFARLMTAFNLERLHNCGFWLGFSQAAYDEASTYVAQREAFGRPVVEFQAVYHTLADMWVQIEALRLLAYRAAADATDGRFPRLAEVTLAKLFGATIGPQITSESTRAPRGIRGHHRLPDPAHPPRRVTNVVAGGAPAVCATGSRPGLFPPPQIPANLGLRDKRIPCRLVPTLSMVHVS